MGLPRDRWRFQSKIAKFSHPLYFAPPLKGFPLELGMGAGGQKTRIMGLPGRQRSLTTSSAVWIECKNVPDRQRGGGQTDGRTDTGPQQRPRLRIASHDKNAAQQTGTGENKTHTETLENKPKTILT